jgi:hypothetical protein
MQLKTLLFSTIVVMSYGSATIDAKYYLVFFLHNVDKYVSVGPYLVTCCIPLLPWCNAGVCWQLAQVLCEKHHAYFGFNDAICCEFFRTVVSAL